MSTHLPLTKAGDRTYDRIYAHPPDDSDVTWIPAARKPRGPLLLVTHQPTRPNLSAAVVYPRVHKRHRNVDHESRQSDPQDDEQHDSLNEREIHAQNGIV
jgi:hypothetical protein